MANGTAPRLNILLRRSKAWQLASNLARCDAKNAATIPSTAECSKLRFDRAFGLDLSLSGVTPGKRE
jgi:hypothetical protein